MVDVAQGGEVNVEVREGRHGFQGGGKTGKTDKGPDSRQGQCERSSSGAMLKMRLEVLQMHKKHKLEILDWHIMQMKYMYLFD